MLWEYKQSSKEGTKPFPQCVMKVMTEGDLGVTYQEDSLLLQVKTL